MNPKKGELGLTLGPKEHVQEMGFGLAGLRDLSVMPLEFE